MPALLLRCAAGALVAITLAPAAQAGDGRTHYDPYAAAARATVCTRAELSAGLDVDQCGRGLLHAAAARKGDRTGSD